MIGMSDRPDRRRPWRGIVHCRMRGYFKT
jgi:hypothetical protein